MLVGAATLGIAGAGAGKVLAEYDTVKGEIFVELSFTIRSSRRVEAAQRAAKQHEPEIVRKSIHFMRAEDGVTPAGYDEKRQKAERFAEQMRKFASAPDSTQPGK